MSNKDHITDADIAPDNVTTNIRDGDTRPTAGSGSASGFSDLSSSKESSQENRGQQEDKKKNKKNEILPLGDTPFVPLLDLAEGVETLPRGSAAENTAMTSIGASRPTFTNPFTQNGGSQNTADSCQPQLPHSTPMLQLDSGDGGTLNYVWQPEHWIVYADYLDGDDSSEDETREPVGG